MDILLRTGPVIQKRFNLVGYERKERRNASEKAMYPNFVFGRRAENTEPAKELIASVIGPKSAQVKPLTAAVLFVQSGRLSS